MVRGKPRLSKAPFALQKGKSFRQAELIKNYDISHLVIYFPVACYCRAEAHLPLTAALAKKVPRERTLAGPAVTLTLVRLDSSDSSLAVFLDSSLAVFLDSSLAVFLLKLLVPPLLLDDEG